MASARQRDGRWTGLYRDQGRQRSAGTYDTKTSALKAARAAEALAASGIDPRPAQTGMLYPSARRGRITLAGYAPGWLSGHRLEPTSRATYEAQLKHIIRDLGSVPLADLDAPKCRSFIRQVEATGLSSSTTGLIMTVLRAMCETAVADRLMDRNPTSGIKIATRHAPSALRSPDLTDHPRCRRSSSPSAGGWPSAYRLPVECIVPKPVSELFIPIDLGLYNPLTLPAGQWPGRTT